MTSNTSLLVFTYTAVVISVGPASSKPLKMIPGIEYPASIATSRNGEIVVASYMSHKVHVYSRDYELLRTFGSQGFMDGQFMCPSGIAVDRQNRVYVSSMSKIDIFTMEGQFLNAAGQQGNGPLQFTNAAGVALGKEGEIYIADAQNNRIQVLNSDLTYRTSFSEASPNLGSGRLSQPQAVAINSEGNLYVTDMMNHAVQVFNTEGKFLLKFGKYGPPTTPGAICTPMAIAIDRQDNVYVGSATGTIGIFDKEGNFLRQFGSYGSELGQFNQIKGMHIDRKGSLYVSEWTSNRIQIFSGSPSMVEPEEKEEERDENETDVAKLLESVKLGSSKPAYLIGPSSSLPSKILSDIKQPSGIAVGRKGEVVVASLKEHKVFVYSAKNDYQKVAEIGGRGDLDGEFWYPSGVAVTRDNQVLVSSYHKLQWFTMEGNFVHAVGGCGMETMEFDIPVDLAVGKDGCIYVLDSNNKRVQILNGDATYQHCFEFPHLTSKDDKPPTALAINSEGNLYFTDSTNSCVHVFSSSGQPLFKFGKSGSWMERGVLTSPMVIAIDAEDNVFVASIMMISIFDKSGNYIRAFGGHGSDPGQFDFIKGMHIDRHGNLYVSEYSNNRVQIFQGSESSQSSKEEEKDDNTPSEQATTISLRKPAYMIGPRSNSPFKILSEIDRACGIAEGRNGEVIVVSQKENKVFVYSLKDDYQKILEIGEKGNLDGRFESPSGVAVTSDNLVLVSSQDKLQWFTMEGKLVYTVGGRGTEQMKFNNPTGVAVSKDGSVYVIDEKNKRVQILNSDATYHGCFGFPHLTGPKDEPPCALAINSEGNLYFADSKNNCVHVFSASAELLFKFGKSGSWKERGTLNNPMAIAVDSEDNIFVADRHKISIFDKSGSFIRGFGRSGSDPGQFSRIKGLCIGKHGHLYVSEDDNNRVQIFECSKPGEAQDHGAGGHIKVLTFRRPAYTIGPSSDKPVKVLSNITEPCGITTAPNGDLYVVSKKGKKVLLYAGHDFEFKEQLDCIYRETSRDNEIVDPKGVTICEDGCLLLNLKNEVVKVTIEGDVIASVGKKGRRGKGESELDSPNGIALGRDGRVYVADSGNNRVQIFNADLSYRSTGSLPDDLRRSDLEKVAVNSHGSVYVTDTRNDCIHVFNEDGKFLFTFGKKGSSSDRGSLSSPTAIAIDHEDYVYVSGSNVGVSIFDREGCFVRAFGPRGDEPGEFRDIKAMHIDQTGNLYVCESGNARVQIFAGIKPLNQGEKDRATFLVEEEARLESASPVMLSDIVQEPYGLAEGWNGEIVVASSSENKVFVYDSSRRLLVQFGCKGELDGQFNKLTGVAVTSDNYILTSSHDKLQWFTMEGKLVFAVGYNGTKELEFNHPDSLAIGKDGRIYILEKQNKRIQILKGDSTYHSSINLKKVDCPFEALTVNSEGKIFLADTRSNCVQVFSPEGTYLSKITNIGSKELALPTAVAMDTKDNLYVGNASGVVAMYDKDGRFMRAFRGSGSDLGQFNVIRGMHVGRSGCIYVSDISNNKVQILTQYKSHPVSNSDWVSSPSTKLLPYRPVFTVGPKSSVPIKILSGIKRPSGITTDPHGNIYVVNEWDDKIIIYGSAATQPRLQITEIKNPRKPRDKRISNPSGVAYTSDGYLLVSFQHQLVKMSLDGTVVKFFGNEENYNGKREDEVDTPGGIVLGQDGRIILVDRGNHRIQILKSSMEYIKSYYNPDEKERSGEYLEDVAINSAGYMYVTDRRSCNVQVFDDKGRFKFTFGKQASSRQYKRGCLRYPYAIAIDREDFVYVGGDDGIVSIFDKKGNFVRSFGGPGDQPGQFDYIRGMHIDSRGQLYVCEWEPNSRVQIFQGQHQ